MNDYSLTNQLDTVDQHGRSIPVAAIVYKGEVVGTIAAEPEGRGVRHVVQAITVEHDDDVRVPTVYHSMPTQSAATFKGQAPSGDQAVMRRRDSLAWNDGYGFGRWAEDGTAVPANMPNAFYDGVIAATKKGGRTWEGGVGAPITGRPASF